MSSGRLAIGAPFILAFDGRGHGLLRDGVVVIENDTILHVGPRFDGQVDETVDAVDRIVTPGLISTHAHLEGSPLDRSFIEGRGNPQFWFSGLFEMLPVRSGAQDDEAARACVDFSMAELLRDAKRFADEVKRPYQVHTAQSVLEFNAMVARHGKTPTAWLHELGVLGPGTILGHAIIVGGSSWTSYPAGDVQLMADSGCSVAHAAWVFARRGVVMESFARYRSAGINMSLGTDTNPQSVIEAMRWAAVLSKIAGAIPRPPPRPTRSMRPRSAERVHSDATISDAWYPPYEEWATRVQPTTV